MSPLPLNAALAETIHQHWKGFFTLLPSFRLEISPPASGKEPTKLIFLTIFQLSIPLTRTELLEPLQHSERRHFKSDFTAFAAACANAREEATSKTRKQYWTHWSAYAKSLRVCPYLVQRRTSYSTKVNALGGFAARVRSGRYGHGRQVTVARVRTIISSIGKTISMDTEHNPTLLKGSDSKIILPLQDAFTVTAWGKADGPTNKKLPVEVDVPAYLVRQAYKLDESALDKRVGDLSLIAFYYLLRVGEYTVKSSTNNAKQTKQFRMRDVAFYIKDKHGNIRQLPRNATDKWILERAVGATLRLTNQKNGWKNVCIHQHATGDDLICPVKALARIYCQNRHRTNDANCFLSTYWDANDIKRDVTNRHISSGVKLAAAALNYPISRGIDIDKIDTHSLRAGGANALSLAGYSDTQIQKMGRWRGNTFKEYISDQLANASEGMSKAMSKTFKFVCVSGGILNDVTTTTLNTPYN